MELLEQHVTPSPPSTVEVDERAARATLRAQIAKLERDLAAVLLTSFPHGEIDCGVAALDRGPRLLGLGELERVRDALSDRLRAARLELTALADRQEQSRVLLERMLLEPGRHRFVRVRRSDIGEPGCGVWHVRPRLGLVGMLMGWWQVKLSSGCPLAWGCGARRSPPPPPDPESPWAVAAASG